MSLKSIVTMGTVAYPVTPCDWLQTWSRMRQLTGDTSGCVRGKEQTIAETTRTLLSTPWPLSIFLAQFSTACIFNCHRALSVLELTGSARESICPYPAAHIHQSQGELVGKYPDPSLLGWDNSESHLHCLPVRDVYSVNNCQEGSIY